MKPFGKNIYFKPQKEESVLETTDGMLADIGEIVAMGDECTDRLKVGDKIVYTIWGPNQVKIGDETHYFVIESDALILGVLE